MTVTFIFFQYFAIIFTYVHAVHFLGGTVTWRPLNSSATGSPVQIVITQTYSWTTVAAPCSSTDIANSNPIPFTNTNGVYNRLNCVVNCGNSGGYVAPPIYPDCTDISTIQDTTVGQRSDIVSISSNADFSVAFASQAWRPLATSASASWSLASAIDLTPRADNGHYNNAPVATVMSPISIPQNIPKVIYVPVADADGDTIRCRWSSSSAECAGVCPPTSLPSGTIIYPNCTIVITGTVVGNWFAIAITVSIEVCNFLLFS